MRSPHDAFAILMYHALWPPLDNPQALKAYWDADPHLAKAGARRYALDQRHFTRQMEAIAQAGKTTPSSWEDLMPSATHAAVWITFDDGHVSNLELALPVLRRFGLRAIFFITTDWIGTKGFMNEQQLRELDGSGMLLGTHGCSHRYFADLSESELRSEMVESKARLEAILGHDVPGLALPGGSNHPAVKRLAGELGYQHVFGSRVALAQGDEDPLEWPRIPMTNGMPEDFLSHLMRGDTAALEHMGRSARLRGLIRRMLGSTAYDRLRSALIRNGHSHK